MLQPTRAASAPTTRTGTPTEVRRADKPGSAHGDDAFRRVVAAQSSKRDARDDKGASRQLGETGALVARADGALVVTASYPTATRAPSPATAPPARASAPRAPVALANVRVGGAPGTASVHATLGEGRHAGVELRAVERNGRVAIELVATTPAGERALRGELEGLRHAIAARGCEGVSVDVRSGGDDGRERRAHDEAVLVGDGPGTPASGEPPADGAAPLVAGEILL